MFCLTVSKKFVGFPLVFHYIRVSKKLMDKEGDGGREYQDFLKKLFRLTVPKIFVEEPFSASLKSGIKMLYGQEGGRSRQGLSRCFTENFLSHSAENIRR